MATNNFLNMVGDHARVRRALRFCSDSSRLTPDRILLVFGVLTLLSSVYVLSIVPEFLVRFSLWLLTHTRLPHPHRRTGERAVARRRRCSSAITCRTSTARSSASCMQRFVRFLVYKPYYEHWAVNPLLTDAARDSGRRRDATHWRDRRRRRRELQHGHVVCIFAEGAISRTGNLLPFKRGFERIVDGLDVPIIPVYLDRVWGSIFSFKGGRFFWKWPVRGSVSGDGGLRRAAAVDDDGCRSAPGAA